ncbi:MAG: alpha/beta hydrolase [Alcanivoracaceae bacterium]|nr:alpha/beta hydrolase [Alcanivoracaceae bacterium]
MNIILLPGMDGTGKLFTPLLKHLNEYNCQVITLPQSGAQDYSTLTNYVKNKLPTGDFILIAESFSGSIAAQLAQQNLKNLKGIVFVATFLSSPNKHLLNLAKILPIKFLIKLPTARFFIKKLFLGDQAHNTLINQFIAAVNQVPTKVLKHRMKTMQSLKIHGFTHLLPSIYIQPQSDKLVPNTKVLELQKTFKKIIIKRIEGPHFILQAMPEKCADIITTFINTL